MWMAFATLLATWFGAGSSMGGGGTVYSDGLPAIISDPFAASLSLIIAGCVTVDGFSDDVFNCGAMYGFFAGIITYYICVSIFKTTPVLLEIPTGDEEEKAAA